jgi:Mg2+/Co2+ transporter CorB
VPIRELNRDLDWNLPDNEATTIAGLVIHEARTIPEPGQRFAFFGYQFEILRRQRNQITALRIIPPANVTTKASAPAKPPLA